MKLCSAHPKYKALRMPRVPCQECWTAWFNVGPLVEAAKTFVERCERGEVRSRRTYTALKAALVAQRAAKMPAHWLKDLL